MIDAVLVCEEGSQVKDEGLLAADVELLKIAHIGHDQPNPLIAGQEPRMAGGKVINDNHRLEALAQQTTHQARPDSSRSAGYDRRVSYGTQA